MKMQTCGFRDKPVFSLFVAEFACSSQNPQFGLNMDYTVQPKFLPVMSANNTKI